MKIKPSGFLIALFVMCISAIAAKAQNSYIPTVFQKTPNSAAFAKYGDYPVNLYSGLPEISIPLYTVEAGGLQVPITLSYHASGLKVNEPASTIGAGWSLSSGGGITRNIIGRADDNMGYFTQFRSDTNFHPITIESDLDYLRLAATGPTNNTNDERPDIFSYDLPGHSGKFFFNATNGYTAEFIPFAPMSVTRTGSSPLRFSMRDEHGTNYQLGYSATELTSTAASNGVNVTNITAWKLEQMISQNRRDTISFSYTNKTVNTFSPGETINIEDQQSNGGGSGCPVGYANTNPVDAPSSSDAQMSEQEISQITFRNGKVTFALHSTARSDLNNFKLDSMKVYAYNFGLKRYELQKSVLFYQSYYTAVSGQAPLRLDSIQILDKAGSVIQHYRFVYNNQPVPNYTSFSRDYWGYYNGKMDGVSNPTLIPRTAVSFQPNPLFAPTTLYIGSSDSTSRNPDSTKMQAGVLKTIYYPTGGHTTFAYQTNRYLDAGGVMHLTGGLRIDSISSYDGISSTPIVKTYQYNTSQANFMTFGFTGLINQGFLVHTLLARYWLQGAGSAYNPCVYKRVRSYFAESALNLNPTEGNPVAYTKVTEYVGTPGTNTGKSIYTFRYRADDWDGSATSTTVPVTLDHFYARGQLLEKDDYLHKSDGTYQVVKKTINAYTAYPETLYADVGMVVGQARQSDGITTAYPQVSGDPSDNDVYAYLFDDYSIASDDNYLISTTTQVYDTNDTTKYTVSLENNTYGNIAYQQLATVTHTDSKGNVHITSNKYAFDYLVGGTTNNAVLDTMISHHMYSDVIEKSDSLRNITTSLNGVTSSVLRQFQYGTIANTIVPYKVSVLNALSPLTNFSHSHVLSGSLISDSRYVQMISFDQYDPKNNIAQYTPRSSTPVSILWDYQYELPVAQIKNATYNNTAAGSEVFYTSFEAPRNGGWSYAGAPVTDVTAPTGSFTYPLSAGSVTLSSYDNTKSYVLSLWSNNGAPTVNSGSSLTGSPLKTSNGWTYYEYIVPIAAGTITISGTTSIDELRLYPTNAQMTTYAYDPSGVRSIMSANSLISYFEYDPFQRLKNIKDYNGNIVSNYGYHTYDQTVSNDAIAATVFTRNNCPSGTAPQSTTYSVAASKYVSSTKASANAEAQYDLATNGQAKANNPAICGCPIATASFTLTNTSGYTGWQAVFTGGSNPTYNFPSSGSTVVQIPLGTYTSVYIGPIGSATHTFTLGSRNPITGAHSATFTSVVIATSGSTDTSLTVN